MCKREREKEKKREKEEGWTPMETVKVLTFTCVNNFRVCSITLKLLDIFS